MNVGFDEPWIRGLLALDREAHKEGFVKDFLGVVGCLARLEVRQDRAQSPRCLALILPVMEPLHHEFLAAPVMNRGGRFDDAYEILIAERCGVNFGGLFLPLGKLLFLRLNFAASFRRAAEKRILTGEKRTGGRFINRAVLENTQGSFVKEGAGKCGTFRGFKSHRLREFDQALVGIG